MPEGIGNDVTRTGQRMIRLGTIGAPQGVRGEVRIRSFTGDPAAIGDYGPLFAEDGRRFEITVLRIQKGMAIARIKGVGDRTAAEALNGTDLLIDRAQLPDDELDEDEFFVEDLVGMAVTGPDGERAGRVKAVHNFGAGDIIEIAGPAAGLYAFTRAIFPDIDFAAGTISFVAPDELEVHDTDADGNLT